MSTGVVETNLTIAVGDNSDCQLETVSGKKTKQ